MTGPAVSHGNTRPVDRPTAAGRPTVVKGPMAIAACLAVPGLNHIGLVHHDITVQWTLPFNLEEMTQKEASLEFKIIWTKCFIPNENKLIQIVSYF